MYPGFISWWRREHGEPRHAWTGCYSRQSTRHNRGWDLGASGEEGPGDLGLGGGAFGVRRPLRFLAYKLQLRPEQVGELARILDELKTERAQAAVDHRRTLSAFADGVSGDTFDETKVNAGADIRLQSAERLRRAVVTALSRIHKLLEPEQRAQLAYLIRTGTLVL